MPFTPDTNGDQLTPTLDGDDLTFRAWFEAGQHLYVGRIHIETSQLGGSKRARGPSSEVVGVRCEILRWT